MLSEMKRALLLGVKLARLSKGEAEREVRKLLKFAKVGKHHAKVVAKAAYSAAKREKVMLKNVLAREMKTSKSVARRVVKKARRMKRR